MRRNLTGIALLSVVTLARPALAQQNPFMDLVKAMTNQMSQPTSLFNGPDRGGPDTLHGEVEDHWFDGYDPPSPSWDAVQVPPWLDNEEEKVPVNPIEPEPPGNVILTNGVYSVSGKFLVGAIKWPHEEYLEQYVDGTITEITDDEKVPVYWVAGWRLFIPEGYPADESKEGKALIVQAGRDIVNPLPEANRPPWLSPALDNDEWRDAAAVKAALRLGVPVLMLGPNPVARNVFEENRSGLEQGGVAGYWGEARFDFSGHWSIKAPEADPIRDHPQFLYVASYIRARTFLEGFFNPAANGTTSWSKWDDITNNNTARYTPIRDVTLAVCPHYALHAQLACAVDPALTDLTIMESDACPAATTLDPNFDRRELDMDRNQLPALPVSSAWAENLLRAAPNR